MLQQINNIMMIDSSEAQLDYYKNALIAQIQSGRIWCAFNKAAPNWTEKKGQLDSLEFDLAQIKNKLRVLNNSTFKQQIQNR